MPLAVVVVRVTGPTTRRITASDDPPDALAGDYSWSFTTAAPVAASGTPLPELTRLVEVMAVLRQHCPWDAQQTHREQHEQDGESVCAPTIRKPAASIIRCPAR